MAAVVTELEQRPVRRRTARWWAFVGTLCAALVLGLVAPTAASAAPDETRANAVRGGDTLYATGGARCVVGYNATDGTAYFGILPGHCGTVGTQWYADAGLTIPVGSTSAAEFPVSSWSVVRYTNPDLDYPSEIAGSPQPVRITGAAEPMVGQSACRYGPTTGLHCGTVLAVNQSITFPDGTIHGLFTTNICAEPGDTGGPAFAGDKALGILIGGSGNCTSGGTTYYQPVTPVLATLGLTIGY